jgi:hypothetical protein
MATIAGILLLQSGLPSVSTPIDFLLSTAPIDGAGQVVTGRKIRTLTDPVTGAYSQTLTEGFYWVLIPATSAFMIVVPTGTGTFPLDDLVVTGEPPQTIKTSTYDTVAEMITDPKPDWSFANTENYAAGDHIFASWQKLAADTHLTANGSDIQTLADGRLALRYYIRPS